MTGLAISPLSIEEEKITKGLNELTRNLHQKDDGLSQQLCSYIHVIHRSYNEDVLNFAKAAIIIDISTKVYSDKIDHLSHQTDSFNEFFSENQKQNKDNDDGNVNGENVDERAVAARKRRKHRGDVNEDDFLEIVNSCTKAPDESNLKASKLTFLDTPSMLVQIKKGRQRINVTEHPGDEKKCRLRDWVLTSDMMLVRELFSSCALSEASRLFSEDCDDSEVSVAGADWGSVCGGDIDPIPIGDIDPIPIGDMDSAPITPQPFDDCIQTASRRQRAESESTVVEERRIGLERERGYKRAVLLTVATDIPMKKLKSGSSTRNVCTLCESKDLHSRKGKRCAKDFKLDSFESYFFPHVQPSVGELNYGILPDEELLNLYKQQAKEIEHLAKQRTQVPLENVRGDFLGFPDNDALDVGVDIDDDIRDDVELPLPDMSPLSPRVVSEELDRSLRASKNSQQAEHIGQKMDEITKSEEWTTRISGWHTSLTAKIVESQKRGAMDMGNLASAILSKFPQNSVASTQPSMPFDQLVTGLQQRDIPRYFFACLQLTNEGCMDIKRGSGIDSMSVIKLKSVRTVPEEELGNENEKSPSKSRQNDDRSKRAHSPDEDDHCDKRAKKTKNASKRTPLEAILRF